ncbi:neuraminidase-like domain-containing protein [Maribacter polysaccharolyticus]|uniref:Tc toxin subunit A-related protein n=1 Tax=Maribacter polysaccharolyticus TaxID=3020831 RepID=UPI00237FB91D|nr:neuraminidase-like domain-containing protein [Maribacter polysaccharolyticus]MDE3742115.1 neuraminidase-like domain-containing protein [Maribacter polysaccharolyticus]
MAKQKTTSKRKVKEVIDPQIKIDATRLKAIPGLGKVKSDILTTFTAGSIDAKKSLIRKWQGDKSITDTQKEVLLGSIGLLEVTGDNTAIVSLLGKSGVTKIQDLVKFDQDSLGDLIAKDPNTQEKGKEAKEMALDILKDAERKHPSTFFMNRLFVNPKAANIDAKLIKKPSKELKTFYSKNSSYDLLSDPIISAKTGQLNEKIVYSGKVTPKLVKELTTAQQALQLGRDSDLSLLLYSKGITISKALDMSYTGLMKETGIDPETAMQVKARAQAQHETAMNGLFAYMDIVDPTLKNTIYSYADLSHMIFGPGKIAWEAVKEIHGLKDLDSIADLFGTQDFCDCEHCKSVLSPAAYFVDLMQFVEKRVMKKEGATEDTLPDTHSIHLKNRRPDLWKLPLTCDNTNKSVPYIDCIVEVLSDFIHAQLGASKSVEDRLAEEVSDIEFSLPYNHPLEKVRHWLRHFELSRLEVLEYLYPNPSANERLIIALEKLNLSKEQYNVIIKQTHTAKVDIDVLEFRKKSGLSPEDTEKLVTLPFWENKLSIDRKSDPSDIQKFTMQFKSTLPKWQGTLHRLYRFWKATGLSLDDFNTIAKVYDLKHNSLKKDTILKFADFLRLKDALKLDIQTTAAILNGISEDSNANFSWPNILPSTWITDQQIEIKELIENQTDEAIELNLRLQGIYSILSTEIGTCLQMLESVVGFDPGDGKKYVKFDRPTLNTLYQYLEIFKWTSLESMNDFMRLIVIWGDGSFTPFNSSIEQILAFDTFLKSYAKFGYTADDLIYLFDESLVEQTVNTDSQTFLASAETKALLASDEFQSGDKFAVLYNSWLSMDKSVLSYLRGFIEKSDSALNTLFNSLSQTTIPDQTIIDLSNIKLSLERLNLIITVSKISNEALIKLGEESNTLLYPKLGFSAWNDKSWIKGFSILSNWISETADLYNFDIWTVLKNIERGTLDGDDFIKSIVKWKGVTNADVPDIFGTTSSVMQINAALERVDWAKKLNLNFALVERLKTNNSLDNLKEQEQLLLNAIRSTYTNNDTFKEGNQELESKLNSKLRDALVAFIIYNKPIRTKNYGFKDITDLYNYFLLDISMGDCFMLPKVVIATNSLQTYINRCLLGLEVSRDEKYFIILDLDEKEEWEWRKNYRVWEANRKIFLFPENYIEPEIRDNKTSEFKELEDELLQQKLDLEVVESAYKKYIHQVMKLAELKIVGAYRDYWNGINRIYLFGRTSTQPNEYYYRHVEILSDGAKIWSNWEKMNVAIPAEDVSAVRLNSKLYVFWTSYQRRDINIIDGQDQKLLAHIYDIFANYTYQKIDGKWSEPQKIDLGFRKSSKFDPFLRKFSDDAADSQIQDPALQDHNKQDFISGSTPSTMDLTDLAKELRENVLKSFEKTVYRKPYPKIVRGDSNELSLYHIWTDKEEALAPRYKYTRAIYDAFEEDITIKIVRDWWFDGEHDFTFPFNRFDRIVLYPSSTSQEAPPTTFTIPDQTVGFTLGDDILNFTVKFDVPNLKYRIIPQSSSGNDKYFFKNLNEVANGSFYLDHQIDYIPISALKTQKSTVDITHQILKSKREQNLSVEYMLNREYNTYFDNFKSFHVGHRNSILLSSTSIQNQRDFISELAIGSLPRIPLNPEGLQSLWQNISISVNELLHHKNQNHVKTQIDYNESFGNYFYEIFFHIPMRIADHLNAAGKFREADIWYRFVYDPTNTKDEFERLAFPADVNWNFAAFRELGIKKLEDIYSNENAIEQYRRNPGNPHAIARMRISAYQKNVVMKYLDNLMDWADYLFEQYTPESTSEARNLYAMVKNILGDKPQSVGSCSESDELKYEDINFHLNEATGEFIYNMFTKVPLKASGSAYSKMEEETYVNKFAERLEARANMKTYNYVGRKSDKKAYYDHKESSFSNKDVSKYKNVVVFNARKSYNIGNLHRDKQVLDKVYGRPHRPVRYINIKSDLIFCFPKNDMFLAYWDRVNDRIYKLNNCMDINGNRRVMPAFAPPIDPALLARMIGGGMSFDDILGALNSGLPYYRFEYLIAKAKEFCGTVQSFGGQLFAAIEKKDSEELTLLRSRHEQNILTLTTSIKRKNLDQAKTSLKILEESKKGLQLKIDHFDQLIEEGLIPWERTEQIAKWTAGSIRIGEGVLQFLSGGLRLVPQLGSPFAMKYGGLELGDSANRFANALAATAKIADNIAVLAGMEGGHQRRDQQWRHQLELEEQAMVGMDEQISNAELAVALAEYDIEMHEKNIAQYQELHEFYTTKFSNLNHYTFQVGQLQKLYKMAYNLAYEMATDAQRAYNFQRGIALAHPGLIEMNNWNSEKVGLLSGEKLMLQLHQLEKGFIDSDKVNKQITQHFSLKQIAPEKLLELKFNGEFRDFAIPEAAFDVTYPGFYRRRIKSVRISIPCISGPYVNIGATLTLGVNKIRQEKDTALIDFSFKGCDTIATSTAQNDGGQFDLNFNGSKYLPFEGAGAISSWSLSLPNTVRSFDYNSISDVIFHISYEAEFDGVLKTSVESTLKTELGKLNGTKTIRTLSLRHDFHSEWHLLNQVSHTTDIELKLQNTHFPYFANVQSIGAIENFTYNLDGNDVLSKVNSSQGITKQSGMKIKIPKTLGTLNLKDVMFFVSYSLS